MPEVDLAGGQAETEHGERSKYKDGLTGTPFFLFSKLSLII